MREGPLPLDRTFDIFVSYTAVDVEWARWIVSCLEGEGFAVRFQDRDFGFGNFVANIQAAVTNSTALVAVTSPEYLDSRWTTDEWTTYLKTQPDKLLPVIVRPTEARSLLDPIVRVNLVGKDEVTAAATLIDNARQLTSPSGERMATRSAPPYPAMAGPGSLRRRRTEPVFPVRDDALRLVLVGRDEAPVTDGTDASTAVDDLVTYLDLPEAEAQVLDLRAAEARPDELMDELAVFLREADDAGATDVLVVVRSRGAVSPDAGVRIEVRSTTKDKRIETSLDFAALQELLEAGDGPRANRWLVFDLVDDSGGPIPIVESSQTPSLSARIDAPDGRLVDRLVAALRADWRDLVDRLPDGQRLTFVDLKRLADGEIQRATANEPGVEAVRGLLPSPLRWPDEVTDVTAWCAVRSGSDDLEPDPNRIANALKVVADSRETIDLGLTTARYPAGLGDDELVTLSANDVLASPRAFADAVARVCNAEICIFDLTNFEPAVMLLLGIRSVIRRAITVCVAGRHTSPWTKEQPPFMLREINILNEPSSNAIVARTEQAARLFVASPLDYADLPGFDLIRAVPTETSRRTKRAIPKTGGGQILALVPFDPVYASKNWGLLEASVPAAVRNVIVRDGATQRVPEAPALVRTLDVDAPDLIPANLYQAIRLTDFCLVDVTGCSPNVLFELGVRLSSNRLHPVTIHDPGWPLAGGPESPLATQVAQLRTLLTLVDFDGDDPDAKPIADRYFELERVANQPGSRSSDVLDGVPAAGVFELAWKFASVSHEVAATPIADVLEKEAEHLLPDRDTGSRPWVFPVGHQLWSATEDAGLDRLTAAWAYLDVQIKSGVGDVELARANYVRVGELLLESLDYSGRADEALYRIVNEAIETMYDQMDDDG